MNIPHHFWTHFWCGWFVGTGISLWCLSGTFTALWATIVCALLVGVVTGAAAGRWGDSFWHWPLRR